MKKKSVITAIALTVCAGIAAPAFAGANPSVKSVEVNLEGLDLDTAAGKAIVERRVERAAKRACDAGGMRQPLAVIELTTACVNAAKAEAMASIYPPKAHIADTGAKPEG